MSRGKSTCGDIDVMITRPPDDGKTHAGMLARNLHSCIADPPLQGIVPKLLSALRSAGIVTEDLSLSSDARDDLECTYRGLCVRPTKAGQDTRPRIQRRIGVHPRAL
jgi:DNA polymerase lambda